jgi:hypothetical protein
MRNIRAIAKRSPSFLKQLHHNGTLSLACLGLTVTSTCCSGFHCLQSFVQANLLRKPINGHDYNTGNYLCDGIYPPWATFVKTISKPRDNKKCHSAQKHEGARKNVEREFGVLHARFAVVRGLAKLWDGETLWEVMTSCVIMHTMIVDDEGEGVPQGLEFQEMGDPVQLSEQNQVTFDYFLQMHQHITIAEPMSSFRMI